MSHPISTLISTLYASKRDNGTAPGHENYLQAIEITIVTRMCPVVPPFSREPAYIKEHFMERSNRDRTTLLILPRYEPCCMNMRGTLHHIYIYLYKLLLLLDLQRC